MPAHAWLGDDKIRLLAAYVYSLSHRAVSDSWMTSGLERHGGDRRFLVDVGLVLVALVSSGRRGEHAVLRSGGPAAAARRGSANF